jgi:glycosyltransferase involved in cell wall biosynthesis
VNSDLKVFVFTLSISPYDVRVFEHLQKEQKDLRLFVSKERLPIRDWKPGWGDLRVTVQKCWSCWAKWSKGQGFAERVWRHFPYDTLWILVRDRPDVVITQQLGFRTMQAVVYRLLFRQSRLIIWLGISDRTEKGTPGWREKLRKVMLRWADAVSANGAGARRYLKRLGVPDEKVFTLPYGTVIDPLVSVPLEREPGVARRLLFVGQLIERKGLAPFLHVLSEWLQKNPAEKCEFWIAGRGLLRGALETFPRPTSLVLRFAGSVQSDELSQIYRQGGIFVFPTLADEWGLPVSEAMVAGLPVLGSVYAQAVEELVEDGVTGWTFRTDETEEMYKALDRAMRVSLGRLAEMRRMARERARRMSPEFGAKCLLGAIHLTQAAETQARVRE